jgi:hypothetical protein
VSLEEAWKEYNKVMAEIRAKAAAAPPMTPEEAINSLRELTSCDCDEAWTGRGMHENHCNSDYREEVEILAKAIAPGEK